MAKKHSETEAKIVSGGTGYNPDISVKKAGKIVLYPVTINELKELKSRSHGDVILNFFFGFTSALVSFFIAYLTCSFDSEYKKLAFLYTTILFAILSVIAFTMWFFIRRKSDELYNEIINREDAA